MPVTHVGFYRGIFQHLPEEALFEALRTLSNGSLKGNDALLREHLVRETLREMTYQEFQAISSYFFSYSLFQGEIVAQPLAVTPTLFETLQQRKEN